MATKSAAHGKVFSKRGVDKTPNQWYNKEKSEGVETMNYLLYIHTNEKEYKEHWYSLEGSFERAQTISSCVNVNFVDLLDATTGEVIITFENGTITDADFETLICRFIKECEEYPI